MKMSSVLFCDVILGQTRWEGEDTSFAVISLWFNQGEGQFAPGDQELTGGFSAAAADVDGAGVKQEAIFSFTGEVDCTLGLDSLAKFVYYPQVILISWIRPHGCDLFIP
jgi:hypothetical protein